MKDDKGAALRDAMRGAMWEEKWRGKLEEHRTPELLEVRGKTWLDVPSLPPVVSEPWPKNRVGLGTYRWKYRPDIIEEAISLGVGLLDTAEGYGFGKVEKELGKILRGGTGDTWVATKVARNHASAAAVLSAGRRSRDNLQVPLIDLYQVHWPVPDRLPETFDGLAGLLSEGVIRRVGVCNFCAGQLATARALAVERGFDVVSDQIRVSRGDPSAAEYLAPYCESVGVRVIAYSPFDQGAASSKGSKELGWVLSQPGVGYVIPATNKVEHLQENVRAGNG